MQSISLEASGSRERSKIAIPRLDRRMPSHPLESPEKHKEERIGRACKTCRKRKIKCSGEIPSCSNCHLISADCVYDPSRRDRLKDATELNHTLVTLLRDLRGRVDNEDTQRIDDALNEASGDLISQATIETQASLGKRSRKQSDGHTSSGHGEAHVTGSVGSNENLDHLDEDLLRSHESRATGYVGENSEVRWLSSVQRQTEHPGTEPQQPLHGPPGAGKDAANARSDAFNERRDKARTSSRQGSMRHITENTFYLDSEALETNTIVDPDADPEPGVAEWLFNCYYQTVHPSYPLVPEDFKGEFRKYLKSLKLKSAYKIPQKTRAQINLLFAIAAKYSNLIGTEWEGEKQDHLIYMTRAVRLLSLKDTIMVISEPNIQIVHAMGSLAFYFLAIGHVSRAWVMIGLSIRLALALGLHLRNEDFETGELNKESRVHTWWSLNSIECLMSTTTGRPPVVASEDCTVPLPHSLPGEREKTLRRRTEHDSNAIRPAVAPNQLHLDHINVTIITQKVLLDLYSPRTAAVSWESIQGKISGHLERLEAWASASSLIDTQSRTGPSPRLTREHLLLRMDYWSTKILITRPCLCRIDQRITNQSKGSSQFNTTTAKACVDSALEMVKLFPDDPNLNFIYSTGPWWSITHIIVQSVAVLLLEMAFVNNNGNEKRNPNIIASIKKLIRWLRAMQYNDPVAAQAYKVIWKILKAVAPELQAKANELLAVDEESVTQPQAYNVQHNSFSYQHYEPWPYDYPGPSSTDTSGTLYGQSFYPQQSLNDPLPYQAAPTPYYPDEWNPMPMPLGHPFFTDFDQSAPLAGMQDPWTDPSASTTFDANSPSIDMSWDYAGGGIDPNADPNVDTDVENASQQQQYFH